MLTPTPTPTLTLTPILTLTIARLAVRLRPTQSATAAIGIRVTAEPRERKVSRRTALLSSMPLSMATLTMWTTWLRSELGLGLQG